MRSYAFQRVLLLPSLTGLGAVVVIVLVVMEVVVVGTVHLLDVKSVQNDPQDV